VSIVAACPHCESRFHLQPDLVGKAMRCPNPDCREPFVVEEAKAKSKKPKDAAPPRKGQVTASTATPDLPPIFASPDESEVVEALVVSPPPPPQPKPVPKSSKAPPKPPKVVEAQIVEATVSPAPAPGPREVVWSADADLPGPPLPPKPKAAEFEVVREPDSEADDDEVIVRRKKKKKNLGPVILIGMVVAIVLAGGGIAAYVISSQGKVEKVEAEEADEAYKKQNFADAGKKYEELKGKNPEETRYAYLADLCSVRLAVGSVTSQDNPLLAFEKIKTFISVHKDSPHSKTDKYGLDVFDAGKKLLEDFEKYATARLNDYKGDRKGKAGELKKAEDMLAVGNEFLPMIRTFRDKDAMSMDDLKDRLNAKTAPVIVYEKKRLTVLTQARQAVAIPTDDAIQNARGILSSGGFTDDPEAVDLIQTAEANFLRAIRFEREPANPQPPPATAASILFVAPIGDTKPSLRNPDDPSAVFLAVANHVLYALDEETGAMLWAARVGSGVSDPPTVAQVQLPEGPTDLALVASDVGGKPALTAYVLRTGQPRWSQPLEPKVQPGGDVAKLPPAPAAGAVVVSGTRAYVPIRDASGSVLVFDIATGMKIGRITVGQSISPGAFLRPGTNHLYIAAESRRLFVFDIEAIAAGGDARCLRVIPTDHPTGSLRTMPAILGQPGDDPSPRFLILSQSDGAGMKLRAIPLPPTPPFVPDAPPALEPLPGGAIELAMNGWAWFPPVSDSERITVVTDRNQFRIFGIKQQGNNDDALFPLPSPTIPEPPGGQLIRGLVVPAEEGAYWVLVGGSLLKYRLTLLPNAGLTLVPDKAGLPIGEPTQPAQLNAKRDTACFVVRSANSSGCRAVAVKLRDGAPRWQRQLGLIPSAAPLRTEAGVLLVDGDGGAALIPAAAGANFDPAWIAAPPLNGVTKPTVLAASADGKTVFTIAAVGEGAVAKWIIRRATNGKFDHSGSVNAPGALAGAPVVFNGTLLLPASDGFVYRLILGDGRGIEDKLAPGPKWLLNRVVANPECFIAALANDAFITSDGGRVLKRWNWPASAGWSDDNASWNLRERVAAAPLILPAAAGKPARMIAADSTGSVTLFGLDRSDNLIRRWVPGVTAALPSGEVSTIFGLQTDSAGRMLVAYTVKRKQAVCLDADADEPRWITPASEESLVGSPVPLGDGKWLLTDLGGRVSVLNADSGHPAITRDAGFPGAVPETAAVPLGMNRVLVPLSDGSAALIDLAEKK